MMREFQQEWIESSEDRLLWDLTGQYHRETETYDQTVCTGGQGQDGVLPANTRELSLININALQVRRQLLDVAVQAGLTRKDLDWAIRRWHPGY